MNPLPTASLREKKSVLGARLKACGRLLVAFSGGKDSFFLWQAADKILGAANVIPYFIATPFTQASTLDRVAYFRDRFSMPLRELSIDLLKDARLRRNPRQRCFYCKMKIFSALKNEARRLGIAVIADGTTASDLGEHRPGLRALEKLAVESPLRVAGFTTADIVASLKRQGVAAYYLSSSTCLATRFPYGFNLDPEAIQAIGRIEHYLVGSGIYPVRVRHMTDGVRIETVPVHFKKLIAMREGLMRSCRAEGFRFATLDLGGLTSGCWDEFPAATPGRGFFSK